MRLWDRWKYVFLKSFYVHLPIAQVLIAEVLFDADDIAVACFEQARVADRHAAFGVPKEHKLKH